MATKANINLSIVIPAYKERGIIYDNLIRLGEYLKAEQKKIGSYEIIVVVNSPDDTAEQAARAIPSVSRLRVVDEKRRLGKGGAVRLGVFEAVGQNILFMDADLSTPLEHITEIVLMLENTDIAIGVRDLSKMHKTRLRRVASNVANFGTQRIVLPGISDTQCGFKALKADTARDIFGRMQVTSWSFDIEMLAIARKLGYGIALCRINDWHDPKAVGLGGDSPLKAVFAEAVQLMRIKASLLKGEYKQSHYQHDAGQIPYLLP